MFKKVLLVIVVLIVGLLIVAAFMPKSYHVERSIEIEKNSTQVFDYVKYLKNQDHFSYWSSQDPQMEKKYTGTDGTVGFISYWNSTNENVGEGEQEIIGIEEGKRLDFELRFLKPFEATDNAFMVVEPISTNKSKVIWGFDGEMGYPSNLMLVFLDFDKMLGDQLQTGLNNLKKVLENE